MSVSPDDWWRGAVLYQIYPRSFMDASGDGVGDLAGVSARLDYVRSLGVDGVWLSPFFRSPMRDFGYDVSDYRDVDPLFGDLADFDEVLAAARDRRLKVVIDQVWSHSSVDHPWFQESRSSRDNPRADWYVWADPRPDGSPPNNWQAWFGGPAWTWEPQRRQYYLHNFLPGQPDLNFHCLAVRRAILDIARFWLDRGVDGFRLDVANYYVHDPLLRDNPPSGEPAPALPRDMQIHLYNSDQAGTLEFLAELRAVMDSYGARMTLGELAPGSFDLMSRYTKGRSGLHTAYAFDFLKGPMNAPKMAEKLSLWQDEDGAGWPTWAFSNHDVARVATRWGRDAPPGAAAPTFLALLLSLRGTVCLYQGEELGLPEADVPFERLRDPLGLAAWPASRGRDGCRTPMPWTSGPGGGFSVCPETWLPMSEVHRAMAVSVQEADAASHLSIARRLIAIRRSSAALSRGRFRVTSASSDLLVFERVHGDEVVLCLFSVGPQDGVVELPEGRLEPLFIHRVELEGRRAHVSAFGSALMRLPRTATSSV